MFEMIDEEKSSPEKRKILLAKVVAFVVGVAATAGLIYFVASGYLK